jgi:hypothetical protein
MALASNLLVISLCIDPSCVLLPPHSKSRPTANLINGIAAALSTRFNKPIATIRPHLSAAVVEEWGKVRRVDSDAGDTMSASSMGVTRDDTRDATFVRVRMFFLNNSLPL